MSITDGHTFLAYRAQMLRTVQCNFKRKEEFAANAHRCVCGEDDVQSHLFTCPSYAHLAIGLDLEGSDIDLVQFFQRLIQEREEVAERERKNCRSKEKERK